MSHTLTEIKNSNTCPIKTPVLRDIPIDLPESNRLQLVSMLNQTLSSCVDLKYQVKQAHWNVKGMNFFALHTMFDQMAGELEPFIDLLAERATTLGGEAHGTIQMSTDTTILDTYPDGVTAGVDHLHLLVERYSVMAKHVRLCISNAEDLNDSATADMYTELSRHFDLRLWFLESHLN